jgi:phage repressor protein C with HTH and peptisase S24 domain
MNMAAIVRRIEQRLEERDISAAAASKMATNSQDTIRNWQRAVAEDPSTSKGPTLVKLIPLAEVLDVPVEWLITGNKPARVIVTGRVGAGAVIEPIDLNDNDDWVDLPPGWDAAQAFRIRGASCEPVFMDGDIVLAGPVAHDEPDFLHRYCVVETDLEGVPAAYLKKIERGVVLGTGSGSDRRYNLVSDNQEVPLPNKSIRNPRPVLMRLIQGGR